ncbi:MAG: aldehyde dehydrogenase family protein, partial [Bacteroidota bacterium]
MTHNKNFINGIWTGALDGRTWQVINPATEETVETVPFGNAADAEEAVDAAVRSQKAWAGTNPYQRADILKQVAHLMRTRAAELSAITVAESGKPAVEARGEWVVAAQFFEWFAEEGKR